MLLHRVGTVLLHDFNFWYVMAQCNGEICQLAFAGLLRCFKYMHLLAYNFSMKLIISAFCTCIYVISWKLHRWRCNIYSLLGIKPVKYWYLLKIQNCTAVHGPFACLTSNANWSANDVVVRVNKCFCKRVLENEWNLVRIRQDVVNIWILAWIEQKV